MSRIFANLYRNVRGLIPNFSATSLARTQNGQPSFQKITAYINNPSLNMFRWHLVYLAFRIKPVDTLDGSYRISQSEVKT